MQIAYLICTNSRLKQAQLQMDLIKTVYSEQPLLSNIDIFHAYNDKPEKYIEHREVDKVIIENRGLYDGAADLINAGIKKILGSKKKYDFIIVASADVAFIDADAIVEALKALQSKKYVIAGSVWFFQPAFSTEFFIVEAEFARSIFPINIDKYREKHKLLSEASKTKINFPILEWATFSSLIKHTDINKIYLFPRRRFAHWINHRIDSYAKYYSPHSIEELSKIFEINGIDLPITNTKD